MQVHSRAWEIPYTAVGLKRWGGSIIFPLPIHPPPSISCHILYPLPSARFSYPCLLVESSLSVLVLLTPSRCSHLSAYLTLTYFICCAPLSAGTPLATPHLGSHFPSLSPCVPLTYPAFQPCGLLAVLRIFFSGSSRSSRLLSLFSHLLFHS